VVSRDSTAAGRAAYARPDRTADAHTMDARRDRCHPIRPGAATPDIIKLTQLTNEFTHLRLTGRHRDALGQPIAVDERVEIREWWRAIQAAHHLAPPGQETRPRNWRSCDASLKDLSGRRPGSGG
jgi:hypothetical protein